jgi:hypothetical protein
MFDLNDPIWPTLRTRSADGTSIIPVVSSLPATDARYYELLRELCDLDTFTVFSASYAVLPHLAAFAAQCESPINRKWPLFIAAAITSTYKCNADNAVPWQLESDFATASKNLQQLAVDFVSNYPDDDPDLMLALGLPAVLDTSTRAVFGNPVPGSFFLSKWFEARRPSSTAT